MKLSEVKNHLQSLTKIGFKLPNGKLVPSHFHVTEIGKITKEFIDCGGKVRVEKRISFQLWEENDYNHRLHPEKLISIIELSENIFKFDDSEIEVEYQGKDTIAKYNLDFDGTHFLLIPQFTTCLAKEACGVPKKSEKVNVCDTASGCC